MNKIAVLYVNYSMEMGGIETLIYELTQNINRQIYKPEVLVLFKGGVLEKSLIDKGIPFHCIEKGKGFRWFVVARLSRIIDERRIKIIHTNNYDTWLYGVLAAKKNGKVMHVHTQHSNLVSKKKKYVESLLGRFTNEVVAVSAYVKDSLKEYWSKRKPIHVIHNGIDVHRFCPNTNIRSKTRNEYGISDDIFLLGIVARLVPVKDHKTLFKAFSLLSSKINNISLFVIGDGVLRSELEEESANMGLKNKITFLGERQDIYAILPAIDSFVLSSVSEGLSVTLLEAMSTGLPIVATNVGGNTEIVEDGYNGFLVPSKNHEALSKAIEKLYLNRDLHKQMATNARKKAIDHFSLDKWIDSYERLYSMYINGKNKHESIDVHKFISQS